MLRLQGGHGKRVLLDVCVLAYIRVLGKEGTECREAREEGCWWVHVYVQTHKHVVANQVC